MTETMTALFGGQGPDWVAREVPVPEPGPGQVLVRTHAVALNNADPQMLAEFDTPGSDNAYVAGYEFAGDIAALGPGTHNLTVGDRVMGTAPSSFAQFVLADYRHVIAMPDNLEYNETTALPTALLTEHGALMLAGYTPGQTVLITAATSGIGLLGVQIAKALGAAAVIGTTRSADKEDVLIKAGADTVVVTTNRNLTDAVLEATEGRGVDVVLDHAGGQTLAACLPATRDGGHLVNIGRLDAAQSTIDLDALSYRHLHLHGASFGFGRAEELGNVIAALADEVMPAVADGRIRPVIDSIYPFAEAADAAHRMRSGNTVGKIVMPMP
ncbi:alcohol dehydrogenase [Rhodococcus sp. ACPA4]|uniref:quinone oxidoreductase family protein n=1 Tax=Rhodococcus TaxID=1827 RepID=UPI0005E192EA|nr:MULTISPECIES: zinc-binding dehydrogenase [Rhodococcus]KJF24377.1 Beta-ketoacyl-acyl-carrier-protein synthase I [Rhodococcus sp. AD45]PBC43271.1 alcohol dehydrogenase [Rhodococcus sp. ACPA4]PSR42682.1 alcohol dehydrogenase [Rhodococcus sp. AD45-ID]ROZ43216.1 alcohol dehydrogenase [Rhodococcus sp. WS3]